MVPGLGWGCRASVAPPSLAVPTLHPRACFQGQTHSFSSFFHPQASGIWPFLLLSPQLPPRQAPQPFSTQGFLPTLEGPPGKGQC